MFADIMGVERLCQVQADSGEGLTTYLHLLFMFDQIEEFSRNVWKNFNSMGEMYYIYILSLL